MEPMGTQSEDFCEIDWTRNTVRHHCHVYPDGTITEMGS
jgi:hypothetical protein